MESSAAQCLTDRKRVADWLPVWLFSNVGDSPINGDKHHHGQSEKHQVPDALLIHDSSM
jgi:hypothetical protein